MGSHFGLGAPAILFWWGLGCSLELRDFDPWPYRPASLQKKILSTIAATKRQFPPPHPAESRPPFEFVVDFLRCHQGCPFFRCSGLVLSTWGFKLPKWVSAFVLVSLVEKPPNKGTCSSVEK